MATPFDHAVHHVHHPGGALPTGRALAAGLVFVELHVNDCSITMSISTNICRTHGGETSNGLDDVGALVHDDDGAGPQTRLRIFERVVIHTSRRP